MEYHYEGLVETTITVKGLLRVKGYVEIEGRDEEPTPEQIEVAKQDALNRAQRELQGSDLLSPDRLRVDFYDSLEIEAFAIHANTLAMETD